MKQASVCWVPLLIGGVAFATIGQALISHFLSVVDSPISTTFLDDGAFLLGVTSAAFGTSLFSRSSPGLLGEEPKPTHHRHSVFEIAATAIMITGTTCLAWFTIQATKIITDPGLPDWERLVGGLGIPTVGLAVVTLSLIWMGRYVRQQRKKELATETTTCTNFWIAVGLGVAALLALITSRRHARR